jgi:cation:H+ antiporter
VSGLSTPLVVAVFVAGSAATWVAGTALSKSTDSLDRRFGLGDELGGLILLAIAGTLPEIAIVASAAVAGHLDIAVGNLIGGVAMQTLVLVVLDATSGPKRPLSYLVGSLTPVLEALIVVVCLATVLAGAALPASTSVGGVSPTSIAVVLFWLGGVWIVNGVRTRTDWTIEMPGSRPGRRHVREDHPQERRPFANRSTAPVVGVFAAAAGSRSPRASRSSRPATSSPTGWGSRARSSAPPCWPQRPRCRRSPAGSQPSGSATISSPSATSSAATRSSSPCSCSQTSSPALR